MMEGEEPGGSPRDRLLDLLDVMLAFVAEFQSELVGGLLLVTSLVSLISLASPAGGLLSWWHHGLARLLGWGAFPGAMLVGGAGAILLARRWTDRVLLIWQQVVGWELAFFALLGMLHLFPSAEGPAALAEAGRGGGYVGWGIARFVQGLAGVAGGILLLLVVGIVGGLMAGRVPFTRLEDLFLSIKDEALVLIGRLRPDRDTDDGEYIQDEIPDDEDEAAGLEEEPVEPARTRTRARKARRRERVPYQGADRDPDLPPLELLRPESARVQENGDAELKGEIILETLTGFGIPARIVDINRGPTVTQFGVEPGFVRLRDEQGHEVLRKVKVSKINALSNDLALALSAPSIRIEAPVPGRPYVGIEVPNDQTTMVALRGIMESEEFAHVKSPLAFALGRDVSGAPVAADLATMPHLLIAGATGSGKSVCINTLVTCLLCQNHPDTLRLLMVDPKRVELTGYNGVPHLLAPVVVDLDQVVGALNWVVREMQSRYDQFAGAGARHLIDYNRKVARRGGTPLPYLVVVIDELADVMMMSPLEIEQSICRIAQMARATGIHLVIATQRPSVDVVTGLIKANFPARISFAVTSQVDSRVVLDTAGAEKLLGRGDMLYMAPDASKLARLQGCFVSDKEIQSVVKFWQKAVQARALEQAEEDDDDASPSRPSLEPEPAAISAYPWEGDAELNGDDGGDAMLGDAVALLAGKATISTSYLQRALRIGYPRAARLVDLLEESGYVGPNPGGGRPRDVLRGSDD